MFVSVKEAVMGRQRCLVRSIVRTPREAEIELASGSAAEQRARLLRNACFLNHCDWRPCR